MIWPEKRAGFGTARRQPSVEQFSIVQMIDDAA